MLSQIDAKVNPAKTAKRAAWWSTISSDRIKAITAQSVNQPAQSRAEAGALSPSAGTNDVGRSMGLIVSQCRGVGDYAGIAMMAGVAVRLLVVGVEFDRNPPSGVEFMVGMATEGRRIFRVLDRCELIQMAER